MPFELPFDTVRSTNEWSLEAIKWCGLGVIKVSLVRSDFHTLTCELLSNMNNGHNTFFVAVLWLIMWCSIYLLLLTLQMRCFILINAENNCYFDPDGSTSQDWPPCFLVSQASTRAFGTCAIWFTLSRATFEPIEKCQMNFRWIVQIHADFTSNKVFS